MSRYPLRSEKELIRSAGGTVWRFKFRAAAFSAVVFSLTLLSIAVAEREYRSEAILFVRLGRESVTLDPTATTGPTVGLNESRETEIESTRQLLTNRGLYERLVERLGADYILDPPTATGQTSEGGTASLIDFSALWSGAYERLAAWGLTDPVSRQERAVLELEKMLSAGVREQTNIIEVGCDSTSAAHARVLLQELLDEFLADHQRAHRTRGSYDFFRQQTDEAQADLVAAAARLRDLKNDSAMLSIDGRREALQAQINSVELAMLGNDAELVATEKRLESLHAATEALPESLVIARNEGLANEAADAMRQELYQLEILQQELRAKRTSEHPLVKAIDRQVEEANAVLADQPGLRENWTTGPNPVRQPLEIQSQQELAQRAALEAKRDELVAQRTRLLAETRELNKREVQIAQLEREISILEGAFASHAARLEQARVDQGLELSEISNINIIQPPSFSEKPVRPKKLLSLLVGLAAAFAGSLGLIYLSAIWDDTLHSVSEIETTSRLPVLATVQLRESPDTRIVL